MKSELARAEFMPTQHNVEFKFHNLTKTPNLKDILIQNNRNL